MYKKIQIITIILLALTACSRLKEARNAYDSKDFLRALEIAKSKVRQDSTHTAAWMLAGDCYHKLSKLDSALLCYETALALKPSSEDTKRKLTALYVQRATQKGVDDREALNLLNKAEKCTPYSYDALFCRGEVYDRLGYLKKARADFSRAGEISPADPRPAKQLQELEQKQEKVDKLYKTGLAAYKNKKWITATKNLGHAAELNKEDTDVAYMAHLAKGRRAYKKGSVSALWDGIAELGFAIELKPEEAEPWFVMAQCYEKKDRNDFTSAIEPYEKVIELAPHSPYAKIAQKRIKKLNTMRERREKFFGKKKK